jgi:hypothetical protein
MGDELDLHRSRVDPIWPKDTFDLSPVGQLHFHLHHYITRVGLERTTPSSRRRVVLRFTVPEGADAYVGALKEWLARRLLKQARRTNTVLEPEFDGAFTWDDVIAIDEEVVPGPIYRELPGPAQRQLAVEVSGARLLDRSAIRSEISQGIASRSRSSAVIGLRDNAQSDIAYIVEWTTSLARAQPAIPLCLDFTLLAGHDVLDLPDVFRDLLNTEQDFVAGLARERPSRTFDVDGVRSADTPFELADKLVDVLQRGDIILMLQNSGRASSTARTWCTELVHRVAAASGGFLLMIDKKRIDLPDGSALHNLKPYREKQISRHLMEQLGYSADQANTEGAAVFQLARGSPSRTLYDMLGRVTNFVEPKL